jgi:HPt (histidine-containing phosphotransfer) domain-containing protein
MFIQILLVFEMIDLSYLKTTTENDPAIIKKLIKLFLEQLPELKNNILTAYENQNWEVLREAAHKAKSSFHIFGDLKQADELGKMQMMAKENRPKLEYEKLISNFKDSCNQMLIELEEVINEN